MQDTLANQGAEIGRTVGGLNLKAIEEIGQLLFEEPPTTGNMDTVSSADAVKVGSAK